MTITIFIIFTIHFKDQFNYYQIYKINKNFFRCIIKYLIANYCY